MAQGIEEIGLSRDLIIHPGETIAEVIEERGMSQRELAIRTGMTEKHISTVISGQKNISPLFARRLEYALGIDASFWMNLQNNYDEEILSYEEIHAISDEEFSILDNLDVTANSLADYDFFKVSDDKVEMVLNYRKFFGVSDLTNIPKLSSLNSYSFPANSNAELYALFTWLKLCELLNKDNVITHNFNIDKLLKCIPDIKKAMYEKPHIIQKYLSDIFSKCGIAFCIVPKIKGISAKGYIRKNNSGAVLLCVTGNQKYADEFWLDIFHELSHLINGDVKNSFIDFEDSNEGIDLKAEIKAENYLIERQDYIEFVASKKYERIVEIERFAKNQNVPDFIVKSRLAKDKYITWNERKILEWGA